MTSDDRPATAPPAAPPVAVAPGYRPPRWHLAVVIAFASTALVLLGAVVGGVTFGWAALGFDSGRCLQLDHGSVDTDYQTMTMGVDCDDPDALYVVAAQVGTGEDCPSGDYVRSPHPGNCLALRAEVGDCLRPVPYGDGAQAYLRTTKCAGADVVRVLAVHDAVDPACADGVEHEYTRPPRTVCLSG